VSTMLHYRVLEVKLESGSLWGSKQMISRGCFGDE